MLLLGPLAAFPGSGSAATVAASHMIYHYVHHH